jgi:hypothetical protein
VSLDAGKKEPPRHASFNMLTRADVFGAFVGLNPSLQIAARMPRAFTAASLQEAR